eukprot:scaffold6512_cov132-Isochrysis_galbana.AAC.2
MERTRGWGRCFRDGETRCGAVCGFGAEMGGEWSSQICWESCVVVEWQDCPSATSACGWKHEVSFIFGRGIHYH